MKCKRCLADKPLAAFYASNRTRCKECVKAGAIAHRQENLEHVRAYDRMRAAQPHRVAARHEYAKTTAGKASRLKANAEYRRRNRDRMAAHNAISKAVLRGQLVAWPCEVCGEKAEAHHPHYDAPLLVTWLCSAHHKQAHALLKKAA